MGEPIFAGRTFYQYYQLGSYDEYHSQDEPLTKKESGSVEPSHSLFGVIWSLQRETGFTHDYILWGEAWSQLMMKIADAPQYRSASEKKIKTIAALPPDTPEEVDRKLLDFFNENS